MRVKFANGFETNLPHEIGASFVAAGMATEIVPHVVKAASPNTGESEFAVTNSAKQVVARALRDVRGIRRVSTGLSTTEERALDARTEQYRAPAKRGDAELTLGALCAFLGVTAVELREMSDERLHHLATTVPPVPTAVDGSEWGQPPFRYAEFLQRGETWLGFLRRLRVTWADLRTWERCQVERRAKAMYYDVQKQPDLPKEAEGHTVLAAQNVAGYV